MKAILIVRSPMSRNQSIDQILSDIQVAIDSALANPTVQAYLTPFGYTPEKLQQGKALYQTALAAQQRQKTEFAEQLGATAALESLRDTAQKYYAQHLKIARIAFKNDAIALAKLALTGDRKRSLSGWLAQTQQFYRAALEDTRLQQGLAPYGVTTEKLTQGQSAVDAVIAANVTQETEKGEARQATQDRDAVLDTLEDWYSDYIAIARLALEDNPQLLETLGIPVAS
ncbi:MAG: hypothetical protein HC890_03465 [Chloroflexaceae bacterium]|nr:hypothetical protein [Chloroflexaceae bacterium]